MLKNTTVEVLGRIPLQNQNGQFCSNYNFRGNTAHGYLELRDAPLTKGNAKSRATVALLEQKKALCKQAVFRLIEKGDKCFCASVIRKHCLMQKSTLRSFTIITNIFIMNS